MYTPHEDYALKGVSNVLKMVNAYFACLDVNVIKFLIGFCKFVFA